MQSFSSSVSGSYIDKVRNHVKLYTLDLKVKDDQYATCVSDWCVYFRSHPHLHCEARHCGWRLRVCSYTDVAMAFLQNFTPEWWLAESNCTLDVTARIVWCVKVKAKAGAAHRETLFTALMSDLLVCEQATVASLQNNLLLRDLGRHNFSPLSLRTRLHRASLPSSSCWEERGTWDFWATETDAVFTPCWTFRVIFRWFNGLDSTHSCLQAKYIYIYYRAGHTGKAMSV